MSLYLKYRPSNFESIVWQEQVKDILKAEIDKNKFSHSYVFFWPRWTGKTSSARIFAKALNCLADSNKPCNECENCKLINSWKTLDFVEIDAASNTQVDKIREEIIDKAIYPPTTLKKKIYIIDEVHMLSKSAFNALLKIMEEPPEYLIFILATTEIHKVPETILSRCEVFNFKRIAKDKIVDRLKFICENENLDFSEEWLELIAKISDGWLRDAIKYLEQVSIIWQINAENVSKFLWIAPERQIQDFLDTLETKDISRIFKNIEELQQNWIDLANFIKDILLYLNEHLEENLEKNIKLVNLLDEVYQNIKNFPTAELAYKTVIWKSRMADNKIRGLSEDSSVGDQDDSHTELVSVSKKSAESEMKWNLDKVGNENLKPESSQPKDNITENDNLWWNKDKQFPDNSLKNPQISKEELLKNISSPIVKWIIKNFWHIEFENWKIQIIIISETNYKILNQSDKLQEIEKAIDKITPNTPFELIYMPKEEYFNKKLLA